MLPCARRLYPHLDVRATQNSPTADRAVLRAGTVLFAAVVLAWPAFYNRYPLLYPDSVSYLGDGTGLARALFLHQFSDYYGYRSLIYSLGILALHWHVTPWPIVAFSALVTSYVFWLLSRALFPERTAFHFLSLVVSVLIAWWGVVSHASHLLLACGLCLFLLAVLVVQGNRLLPSLRAIRPVAAILLAAVLAQVGLNAYLYRQPSLNGNRPPFLLACVIADGPGRWYLQKHCGNSHLAICDRLDKLPDNVDEILWGQQGWSEASTEEQKEMSREEMTVVLGALREYPREELRIFGVHFWGQLLAFGVYGHDANAWIGENIDAAMPGQASRYRRSRQAQGTLDEDFFSSVQDWAVIVSVFVIGLWAVFARRLWSRRLAGLTAIVAYVVLANAAVTGNLSNVEDRYEARVIWLVPLLACTFVLTWIDRRFSRRLSLSPSYP